MQTIELKVKFCKKKTLPYFIRPPSRYVGML